MKIDACLASVNQRERQGRARQRPTKLLSQRFHLCQIFLILLRVLDLLLDGLEDPYGGRVVVAPARGPDRGLTDNGARDEIVCEAIVQAPLHLEKILGLLKESSVPLSEGLEGLRLVCRKGSS